MTRITDPSSGAEDLRARAVASLSRPAPPSRPDSSAALGVLYQLASSPSTAPDALALLHELQVHQVEVDLQGEELRRSQLELQASLNRQAQLYDHAPVGYLTLDGNAVLLGLNRIGATLLGVEPCFLLGRSLDGYLESDGPSTLRAMFGRLAAGSPVEWADLRLRATNGGQPRHVHASACRDPAGEGFLVGMMGYAEPASPRA